MKILFIHQCSQCPYCKPLRSKRYPRCKYKCTFWKEIFKEKTIIPILDTDTVAKFCRLTDAEILLGGSENEFPV